MDRADAGYTYSFWAVTMVQRQPDRFVVGAIPTSAQRDLSRVVVIIPAFNEERNVGSIVLRLRQVFDTVIVVNDGSRDETEEVARLAGAQVISHPKNRGYGAAIQSGLAAAQDHNPLAVVLMDADGQHRYEDVLDLVRPILEGEADVAVGSRFADGRTRVPRMRRVAQHGLTWLSNVASGVKLTDSQSGMRAFGPVALRALVLSSTSMAAASEMQFLAGDAQLRVCEVPIEIRYFDEVKRNPVGHGLDVLNGIIRMISLRRPLLFFAVPGLFVFVVGFWLSLDVVQTFDRVHLLLVGQLIIGVAFTIVGTLSMFTAVILNALQGLRGDFRSQR
jgi:glycosyltransferase involved in cell wall biosynthesis